MTRQPCPHCGFMNFTISAYCGRCEKPLTRIGDAPPIAGAPPPAARPPTGSQPTVSQVVPRRLTPDATGSRQALPGAPPTSPFIPVPAPLPPLTLETPALPVQPIELGGPLPKLKRRPGPDVGDEPGDPHAEVPVEVPSLARLVTAWLLDLAVVALFGAAVFFFEGMILGVTFDATSSGLFVALAEWLNTHRELAFHAAVGSLLFAFGYSTMAALRTGQTLGRKLTNTVLVRQDGQGQTLVRLLVRFLLAVPSAALLGAGYLWAMVDAYHRTWHDLFTGTVTVKRYVRVPGRARA
jgi:uncharacterized RDD family membrane protein YckC